MGVWTKLGGVKDKRAEIAIHPNRDSALSKVIKVKKPPIKGGFFKQTI